MTGRIVAVSGLCGAGKSTAVGFLAQRTGGEVVYFGATVLRVVRERGLQETSASEQIVRIELRDQHGSAYLAKLEAARMKSILEEGRDVFVDAVYNVEELDFLSRLAADFLLIGIEVSFDTRLARLGVRRSTADDGAAAPEARCGGSDPTQEWECAYQGQRANRQ